MQYYIRMFICLHYQNKSNGQCIPSGMGILSLSLKTKQTNKLWGGGVGVGTIQIQECMGLGGITLSQNQTGFEGVWWARGGGGGEDYTDTFLF